MQNFNEIIPFLFLGNKKALELHHTNFSMIINCTPDILFPNTCKKYIRLSIKDDPFECPKLYQLIEETNVLEVIHNHVINNQHVLVHCSMGAQRSCDIVACYLIKYYDLTPNDAIKYIKTKRPIAFLDKLIFIIQLSLFIKIEKYNNIII